MTGYRICGVRVIDPTHGIDRIQDYCVGAADPKTAVDGRGLWLIPGLVDLHVHFREPGFEYKETIASGSQAALAGGVTTVLVMPNTLPPLDTADRVRDQLQRARMANGVDVLVAACATLGQAGEALADIGALAGAGAVAITDDGKPVADDTRMQQALEACVANDLLFMQHAELPYLSRHAPINAGIASRALGIDGQCADAEGVMVERDIALVRQTGARYHVLHVSTKRSLDAIRAAKQEGLQVTCEATPHHLLLSDQVCCGGDTNTKMNPPLRDESDRHALVAALLDGTLDAVATDHAPHAASEKAQGLQNAPFGVIGLETAFAALLSFVHDGRLSESRAVELMTSGPARVLRREKQLGALNNHLSHAMLVDPKLEWCVSQDNFKGKSSNSAFLGMKLRGRVVATFLNGELRYDGGIKQAPNDAGRLSALEKGI